MSANLDLVRSLYAEWEAGDFSSTQWAHPEIELVVADGPSPGSWTGVRAMVAGFRGFLGAWESWRIEADEYRKLDGERVLVLVQITAHGRRSGIAVGQARANLVHLHDGRVTRLVSYWDRERAFADLDLLA
jgi:ketosteroid isomerase-like protein